MKRLVPTFLFVVLAFGVSCSDTDDGYSTLNGTWTVETSGFVAEFTISKGTVEHSQIKIKSTILGEFTAELEQTGGIVYRAANDKKYLRYIQLGTAPYYLKILGLEVNDSKTTLRGNSWHYYLPLERTTEQINEEFIVERK